MIAVSQHPLKTLPIFEQIERLIRDRRRYQMVQMARVAKIALDRLKERQGGRPQTTATQRMWQHWRHFASWFWDRSPLSEHISYGMLVMAY